MPRLWLDHPWRLRVVVLLLAAAVVAGLRLWLPALAPGVEHVVGDLSWRLGAQSRPEKRVVVVDIDEPSLRRIGPWPWARSTLATLSERLAQAGAQVQVYDLVLDAPRPDDAVLAQAWAQTAVVGGQILTIDPATTPHMGEIAGALAASGCPAFAPQTTGFIGNSAGLHPERLSVGHMTPRVEFDGVVRKLPALVCHQGKAYPSLALAALWRVAQADGTRSAPDWTWAQGAGWLAPHAVLTSPSLPGVSAPVDAHGDLRVPFRIDRQAIVSLSAADVLQGTADTGLLKGAIVLVGATAFGLSDAAATPLAAVSSGLEVHVQAIAGLLDHRIPVTPARSPLLAALGMAACAGLLLLVLSRKRWAVPGWLAALGGRAGRSPALGAHARRHDAPVKRLPLVGLGLALACYAGASAALLSADLWLPWFYPALYALLASAALATAEHARTRAQRQRLQAHLGSYLPAPVAERLIVSDPSGTLQVHRREVSVLMADIRNFSAFAAHRSPEETAALLHAFYCLAVDVVEQHGGVVENIVGDSIMAVWNAYAECAQHPAQALAAAKELVRATRALLMRPEEPDRNPLVQPLALGIGLESGMAVVGSFGPRRRRAHVALGEPVSVASRLQHMTQDLSMPILIGPQLAGHLSSDSTESLGDYLLEGIGRQCAIHVPVDWAQLVPAEQLWGSVSSQRPSFDDSGDWIDTATAGGSSPDLSAPAPRGGA